jgi:hypothetical protein
MKMRLEWYRCWIWERNEKKSGSFSARLPFQMTFKFISKSGWKFWKWNWENDDGFFPKDGNLTNSFAHDTKRTCKRDACLVIKCDTSESGNGKKKGVNVRKPLIDSGSSYQLIRLSLNGVIVVVLFPYQRTTKNHRHRQLYYYRVRLYSLAAISYAQMENEEEPKVCL